MDDDTKKRKDLVLALFYVFSRDYFRKEDLGLLLFLLCKKLKKDVFNYTSVWGGVDLQDTLEELSNNDDVLFESSGVDDGDCVYFLCAPGYAKDSFQALDGEGRDGLRWLVETFRGWSTADLQKHVDTFYLERGD